MNTIFTTKFNQIRSVLENKLFITNAWIINGNVTGSNYDDIEICIEYTDIKPTLTQLFDLEEELNILCFFNNVIVITTNTDAYKTDFRWKYKQYHTLLYSRYT